MRIVAPLTILAGLAVAGLLFQSHAIADEDPVVGTRGYVVDSQGYVVRNQFGDCWRSGQWSEEVAVEACDPHLFPDRAEAPAPQPPPAAVQAAPAPAPAPEPARVEETRVLGGAPLFALDDDSLSAEGRAQLDQLMRDVERLDEVERVVVVGHTDNTGEADYNEDLSQRRAASVKDYLVEQGIDPTLIVTEGRGLTEPVASNETREGRAQNRRVEIAIRGKEIVTH
ncbi:OmpA family protein [Thioalkalivibrio denitrificans]|nr:OmpA family protein [Thioalkalivibrio denitrificans]